MYDTHSPAEWARMGSLAVGLYGSALVVYFLLVDADRADLDPRPVVRRAAGVLHQGVVDAGHSLNWAAASGQHYACEFAADARVYARLSLREAALTGAALLMLLRQNPETTR